MSAAPLSPDLEAPRPVTGPGFSDAVTFAFGDPRAEVYGLARVGLTADAASGLAVLFRGRTTVAGRAEGGAARDGGWDGVRAGGVSTRVVEPLTHWTANFDGGDEGAFALEVSALGAPAVVAPDSAAGVAGGMEGYEHLVRVRGTVRAGGEELAVDCLGQRGHSWGENAVFAVARRPRGAIGHGQEKVVAWLVTGGEARLVEDARISTVYDAEGRQRTAGLELWMDEDSHARRAAGEVVCGTSLDLGRLRLDCAFLRWHMEGREGVGRYDVLRKV